MVGNFQLPLIYGAEPTDTPLSRENYSSIYTVYIEYELAVGPTESFLAVQRSKFELRVRTTPGVRFEYERDYTSAPTAHIHASGVSGLLSVALMANLEGTKQKQKRRGELQRLHFPVGGRRFRPSLEDFLCFIIAECGFRGQPGWRNRLLDAREEWLDGQLRAAVGDHPAVAADALRALGYSVEPTERIRRCKGAETELVTKMRRPRGSGRREAGEGTRPCSCTGELTANPWSSAGRGSCPRTRWRNSTGRAARAM